MTKFELHHGAFGYGFTDRQYPNPPPEGAQIIDLAALRREPGRLLAMRLASLKREPRKDPSEPKSRRQVLTSHSIEGTEL